MYYILPDYSLFNSRTTQTINPQEKVKKKLEMLFKPKTYAFADIKITNEEIELIKVNKDALKDKRKFKQNIVLKFTKPGPKPKTETETVNKQESKKQENKKQTDSNPKDSKKVENTKREKLKD